MKPKYMTVLIIFIVSSTCLNVVLKGSGDIHIGKPSIMRDKRLTQNQVSSSSTSEKVPIKENENKKLESKFETVEIIKRDHIWDKSPEYVSTQTKEDMKTATILNATKDSTNDLTERPNFLSPVIRSHPTTVSTPVNIEGAPTYDLDSIRKKHYFEMLAKGPNSDPHLLNFGGDNLTPSAPVVQSQAFINMLPQKISLPVPTAVPIPQVPINVQMQPQSGIPLPPITQSLINQPITIKSNEQHFDMKVSYQNGSVQNLNDWAIKNIIPDLSSLEEKLQHLEKLNDKELEDVITQMKSYENYLFHENEEIYKNIKKYETQNSVILESVKDEISDANKNLGGMIVEVNQNQRDIVNRELEEEFSKSLSGYTIDKAKFAHLKNLDPKELYQVSSQIKKELDANDNFYLHGDYNFYN